MYSSSKYKIKFKRSSSIEKIEGIALFKSFLNNFIKLKGIPKKFKRIKIKKRSYIERKKIPRSFQSFFYFIFFFYLNKFNIIIDSYNKKGHSLLNLVKLYNYYNYNKNKKKPKLNYIFRFKSKKLFRRRKNKKYDIFYNNNFCLDKNRMSFLFFY